MLNTTVEVALANLFEIRFSDGEGVRQRHNRSASERSLIQRMISAAARFLEALDSVGEGALLRDRAGLVARETAAGTPYDKSRREFIGLFGPTDELSLPPPGEEFGDLRDERHSYVCFPSALRIVMSQTAEYMSWVPDLQATRAFESKLADVPDPLGGSPPQSSQGEERVAEAESAPQSNLANVPDPLTESAPQSSQGNQPIAEAESAPQSSQGNQPVAGSEPITKTSLACPTAIAEAWYVQLHGLQLLAERDFFWGCHLIQLCHEARQPECGDFATTSWLSQHLTPQEEEAMEAILNAAAITASGGGNGNNRQSKSASRTWHSDDFRYVNWFGATYHFTPKQAACVASLWAAWEKNLPGVSKKQLITACDSSGTEVKDVFKGSEAWQTMIVSPNRGYYRLQPPAEAE